MGHQPCESRWGMRAGGRSVQLRGAGSWTAGDSGLQLMLPTSVPSLRAAGPELALARHASASAWVLAVWMRCCPALVEQHWQWWDFPLLALFHPQTRPLSVHSPTPVLPGVFFYLSSAVNPIIYNLLSQRFRLAFLSVISPRCRHWAPKHPTSQIPAQQSIFVIEDHNLADSAEDTSVPGTHRTSVSSSQLSTGLWLAALWPTREGSWRKRLLEITRGDSPKRPISERRAHRLCLREWMNE